MDMAFIRRAERMLAPERPVRLDHTILVATLSAQREAQAVVLAGARLVAEADPLVPDEPMVELLLAGPRWRQAISAQRGCFSRAEAGRRVNAP